MAKKKSKPKTSKQATTTAVPQFENGGVGDVIAEALSKAPPVVLMKVCRLCEMKDGPFLNIFDADKVTAKKIEDLMPFGIAENDDLPHKICFRCSAKVEELHEFIQKCIKTQENLRSAMGKHGPLTMKSRTRVRWEQQLHKTKLSNDDLCDVLIKRAMEGIPLNAPLDEIVEAKSATKISKDLPPPKEVSSESESDDDADISLKQVKLSIDKNDEEPLSTRTSRSSKSNSLLEGLEIHDKNPRNFSKKTQSKPVSQQEKLPEPHKAKPSVPEIVNKEPEKPKPKPPPPPQPPTPPTPPPVEKPPFNIMDYVSTIKVNGVGTLFQCKLCIRNFLRKEMVLNHGCAKNSAPPKGTGSANATPVQPQKPSTVKYIKIDKDPKKPLSSLIDKTVEKPVNPPVEPKPAEPEVKPKPKPRIGPASRIRPRPEQDILKEPTPPTKPAQGPSIPSTPASISFPITPSLNSRYKLVAGPNNTFQLEPVEESTAEEKVEVKEVKKGSKRSSESTKPSSKARHKEKSASPEIIDMEEKNESQKTEPYPVGLFQPVPHHSSVYPPPHPPVPFTTPAMKKQSYTIVQTGNPSKLLISTKPQPVSEEPPKKKSKKKTETKDKEPHSAPSDAAPAKDPGFFTFVSLDPLIQPSYVLPTDNIIQESQITTSTPGAKPPVEKDKEKYPCNMCGETFSREKKLLAHIQSHYNQMDEEDEKRGSKPGPKRRTRK